MPERSMMQITGRNALTALGVGLGFAVLITCLYLVLGSFSLLEEPVNFTFGSLLSEAVRLFEHVSLCTVPIGFLVSFALLQRFRIKK